MRVFNTKLSSKGLLVTSIALLSANALAEDAGRVSFVSGNVTASLPDGSIRPLRRGDAIVGGDKISTQTGRIQIRFSDGGFVSLQPNTVFGVDEYLYSNRKPEETSLFFSLLQGGMRTITGAIGKVNKQSYKVRTPVATIGIRGTGYRASVTPNGLIVSVGAGFVNVSNSFGESNAGAGQNIFVPDTNSPPALGDEQAELQATGVNGDQEQSSEDEAIDDTTNDNSQDDHLDETVAIGNEQDEDGDYVFIDDTQPKDGPGYSLVYAKPGSTGFSGGYNTDPANDESLTNLFDSDGLISATNKPLLKELDRGTASASDVDRADSLDWGRWSNGDVSINRSTVTLSGNDSLHYVTGPMTQPNVFQTFAANSSATYSYQGGTTATGSDGSTGSLNSNSYVQVTFGTIPTMLINLDMDMKDSLNNPIGNYTLNATASVSNLSGSQAPASADFTAGGSIGGSACSSAGACTANISGFFAGAQAQQIGLAYHINDSVKSVNVDGAAAFGRGAITSAGTVP